MKACGSKQSVLYLATFDPTVSSQGTSTRGKLFLQHFSEHYRTHLVHMREKDAEGRDEALMAQLASVAAVDHSTFGYFFLSAALYRAAAAVLRREPIDFVFADFEKAGWYAYRLSRRFGVPYVYSSHNVEFLRYLDFAKRNRLRYPFVPFMYLLERAACTHALLTVSISEDDARNLRRWVPDDRLLTLPCAFDQERFNPFYEAEETARPIVLMVGNYRNAGNREGARLLVRRVVPRVVERRPDVLFRFVGKHFPEELRHPNVEAVGFIEDLLTEYKRASVVAVPITIGGGIKIKVIEGLACGRFVISTPKGLEGVSSEGLVNLRVAKIDDFAQCILQALEHPAAHTTANWERLSESYGVRSQLSFLDEKIEAALRARSPGCPPPPSGSLPDDAASGCRASA